MKKENNICFVMCCIDIIYFVGIGGVGMGGIVEVFVFEGYCIIGFDIVYSVMIECLI